ncbi:hypothetical protein BKI52_02545 [marine bacterium AO1-C]|nr:hypothetical protein BKI52_02545 [marine bacterium AO1-C]
MNKDKQQKSSFLGRRYSLLAPESQTDARNDAKNLGIPNVTFYRLIKSENEINNFLRFVLACNLLGITAKDLHEHFSKDYEQKPEELKARVQALEEFLGEDITTVTVIEPFQIPKDFVKRK